MTRYCVDLHIHPVSSGRPGSQQDALPARRVLVAPCARSAACEVAARYVDAGLVVDWKVRRTGPHRLTGGWSGRFVPDAGDDGPAGVREPLRPQPGNGDLAALS